MRNSRETPKSYNHIQKMFLRNLNNISEGYVISKNEFKRSNTDFDHQYLRGDGHHCEYLNLNGKKQSIVTQYSTILKSYFNELSSAATSPSLSKHFGKSIVSQSYYIKYLNNYVYLSQSGYWADKIILGLIDESLRYILFEGLLPQVNNIYEKCIEGDDIVSHLSPVSISVPDSYGSKHHVLPALNSVSNRSFVWINAGTRVKKISWAPLHPDLHNDQYLAVIVDNENNCNDGHCCIQVYQCSSLTMNLCDSASAHLEFLLLHDWGQITDMCWSPQPLPAVARPVPLIGHLALACSDGFVRIVPLVKRDTLSNIIKVISRHPLLCLGLSGPPLDTRAIPTCMEWCQQDSLHIVVGYSSGHIALYVLDADTISSVSTISDTKVHMRPTFLRRVFQNAVHSLQISPDNPFMVACISTLSPHAILIDLVRPSNHQRDINNDIPNSLGASLIWPESDNFVAVVGGHCTLTPHISSTERSSSKTLSISDVSVAGFNVALNVLTTGTQYGKVHNTYVDSDCLNVETEFFHQYTLIPVYRSRTRHCKCLCHSSCIHGRRPPHLAISVSKAQKRDLPSSDLLSPININGIAVNSNPGSCNWLAVSLSCGLIHIFPLIRNGNSDVNQCCGGDIAQQMFREMCLPLSDCRTFKHSNSKASDSLSIINKSKTRNTTANGMSKDNVSALSSRSNVTTRSMGRTSCTIMDFFITAENMESNRMGIFDRNSQVSVGEKKKNNNPSDYITQSSPQPQAVSQNIDEEVLEDNAIEATNGRSIHEMTAEDIILKRKNVNKPQCEVPRKRRKKHSCDTHLCPGVINEQIPSHFVEDQLERLSKNDDCVTVTISIPRIDCNGGLCVEDNSGIGGSGQPEVVARCLSAQNSEIRMAGDNTEVKNDGSMVLEGRSKQVKRKSAARQARVKHLPALSDSRRGETCESSGDSVSATTSTAIWWDRDSLGRAEDDGLDASHIDDISIVRSSSLKSRLSMAASKSLQEKESDERKETLTKHCVPSVAPMPANPSPELLQTFRSLKLNKVPSVSESMAS